MKIENNQPIENDLSFKNQSLNVLLKIDRSNRKILEKYAADKKQMKKY